MTVRLQFMKISDRTIRAYKKCHTYLSTSIPRQKLHRINRMPGYPPRKRIYPGALEFSTCERCGIGQAGTQGIGSLPRRLRSRCRAIQKNESYSVPVIHHPIPVAGEDAERTVQSIVFRALDRIEGQLFHLLFIRRLPVDQITLSLFVPQRLIRCDPTAAVINSGQRGDIQSIPC